MLLLQISGIAFAFGGDGGSGPGAAHAAPQQAQLVSVHFPHCCGSSARPLRPLTQPQEQLLFAAADSPTHLSSQQHGVPSAQPLRSPGWRRSRPQLRQRVSLQQAARHAAGSGAPGCW